MTFINTFFFVLENNYLYHTENTFDVKQLTKRHPKGSIYGLLKSAKELNNILSAYFLLVNV